MLTSVSIHIYITILIVPFRGQPAAWRAGTAAHMAFSGLGSREELKCGRGDTPPRPAPSFYLKHFCKVRCGYEKVDVHLNLGVHFFRGDLGQEGRESPLTTGTR